MRSVINTRLALAAICSLAIASSGVFANQNKENRYLRRVAEVQHEESNEIVESRLLNQVRH